MITYMFCRAVYVNTVIAFRFNIAETLRRCGLQNNYHNEYYGNLLHKVPIDLPTNMRNLVSRILIISEH